MPGKYVQTATNLEPFELGASLSAALYDQSRNRAIAEANNIDADKFMPLANLSSESAKALLMQRFGSFGRIYEDMALPMLLASTVLPSPEPVEQPIIGRSHDSL